MGTRTATELVNEAVSQLVTWEGDPVALAKQATEQDPKCILAWVLIASFEIFGMSTPFHADPIAVPLNRAKELLTQASEYERLHVQALEKFGSGEHEDAALCWERILLEHPLDVMALKFAHDAYFFVGLSLQIRDSIARVLPFWKPEMPLYGYVLGMYAFGLEESGQFDEALSSATEAIRINCTDAWAIHAVAHVREERGQQHVGLDFLKSNVANWQDSALVCHLYWHMSLYLIELGQFVQALELYDAQVGHRYLQTKMSYDAVDAVSLLFRLELQGQHVGTRWMQLLPPMQEHLSLHLLSFMDAHVAMTLVGCGRWEDVDRHITSMRAFAMQEPVTRARHTARIVGIPVCEAIAHYGRKCYAEAVRALSPVRYQFPLLGGSHAQRDVFWQLLIVSALRSDEREHQLFARALLHERHALKRSSPLTERLKAMLPTP